jgi:hypothetical protein
MEQIRATQIIPIRELSQNPYVAPPKDLELNTKEANGTTVSKTTIDAPSNIGTSVAPVLNPGGANYGDSLNDAAQLPAVPHIINIKQQIINMHDDGTSTIDLVLNIENITGVTEYDIRIAKDAGLI